MRNPKLTVYLEKKQQNIDKAFRQDKSHIERTLVCSLNLRSSAKCNLQLEFLKTVADQITLLPVGGAFWQSANQYQTSILQWDCI